MIRGDFFEPGFEETSFRQNLLPDRSSLKCFPRHTRRSKQHFWKTPHVGHVWLFVSHEIHCTASRALQLENLSLRRLAGHSARLSLSVSLTGSLPGPATEWAVRHWPGTVPPGPCPRPHSLGAGPGPDSGGARPRHHRDGIDHRAAPRRKFKSSWPAIGTMTAIDTHAVAAMSIMARDSVIWRCPIVGLWRDAADPPRPGTIAPSESCDEQLIELQARFCCSDKRRA